MTADKTILRDYFPNYLGENALFTKMSVIGAPWPNEVGQDMDDAYFTMYSGIKNPSEFVLLHLDGETANALTIARILYGIYGDNWTRLWEANKTKYVPIDNYNVQETITRHQTDDRVVDKTDDTTGTVDTTSTITYGQQVDTTGDVNAYSYGFNSPEQVPTTAQREVGTETNSGSDNNTDKTTSSDKQVGNTIDNDELTEDTQRTRTGNVGQNSYQELLRQEFDLWKWNFFMSVFEDVDRFLVLSVHSGCNHFSQLK